MSEAIFDAWTARRISSSIAVMELLIESGDERKVERMILARAHSHGGGGYDELLRLLVGNREGSTHVAEIVRMARRLETSPRRDRSARESIESTKTLFDNSVQECEEASVALYSLGSAEVLRAATEEVMRATMAWGLWGEDKHVLQIGCGIGRFEVALAPYVRRAVGIDVSSKMIDAARRRAAGLSNVHFDVCNGLDLTLFADSMFDVVFAVDSVPYIVEAGMPAVDAHFGEAARVLSPRGEFVIFEFSYRGDIDRDRSDVRRLSAAHGFEVVLDGVAPFQLWNGRVFRMRRAH